MPQPPKLKAALIAERIWRRGDALPANAGFVAAALQGHLSQAPAGAIAVCPALQVNFAAADKFHQNYYMLQPPALIISAPACG